MGSGVAHGAGNRPIVPEAVRWRYLAPGQELPGVQKNRTTAQFLPGTVIALHALVVARW